MDISSKKIVALLGPTNTGKTYLAIEKMLQYESGIFGLPLRLLAREVYDKCVKKVGKEKVALITGEEKIVPGSADYFICTVESMPKDKIVDFIAIDEIQMCADRERGHVFTDRLLNLRGEKITMFLGSQVMKKIIEDLVKNVEFVRQERFSKLTYSGYKKISRLDGKAAIIAFSIEEVYALAELVRRQKGGAAVIMGSLSPKTRNSQVELYQSGDVGYLVATDAIGMGLNMDINEIYFSNLKKFDGKKTRRLSIVEISQIAGRAGRYKNDGNFGTTGDCESLNSDEIEKIENHHLPETKMLYWRNSKLDFKSQENLIASLELKPTNKNLIRINDSVDESVLRHLLKKGENNSLYSQNLELLWECCQIPDFEKKAYGQHINVVDTVFKFLSTRKKRIPNEYMKEQLKGLEKKHGNIDVLANRISNVRTWSYVANKKNWVENSDYWVQFTKNIEDNLSDKLHQELTRSFIDKKISILSKGLKQDLVLKTEVSEENKVLIDGQDIGELKGLKFVVEFTSSTLDTDIKSIKKAARRGIHKELMERVNKIVKDKKIILQEDHKIYWNGNPIARIKKGENYLNPEIEIIADDALPKNSKDDLNIFLKDWMSNYINEELGDLLNLTKIKITNQYLRALVFQIYENNGVMKRNKIENIISLVSKDERKKLWGMGVKLGRYHIYLPKMLKPKAVSLRVNLWKLFYNLSPKNQIPKSGLNFLVNENYNKNFLLLCGFESFKDFFVRVDILEKLFISILDKTKNRKFTITSDMMNLLGCSKENFYKLMDLMNYKKDKDKDTYIFYGDRNKDKKISKNKKITSPFEKLLSLNIK
ncbi:MAG: helicase [Pelagibacterales bacterium MED-G40]|nr:MAG: helicase [Pelagibacterales bacterium MED-G40]|tara:strand:+ start:2102 stop:4567 length:2466 start_codon:yes stop_codon:yes gene_type:complete